MLQCLSPQPPNWIWIFNFQGHLGRNYEIFFSLLWIWKEYDERELRTNEKFFSLLFRTRKTKLWKVTFGFGWWVVIIYKRVGYEWWQGALLHCRCGMTISYNGMKPTTVELVCFGYHPTKCGNQTLCYSTSNLFQLFNHFGSQLQLCALLQCRRKLRGPLQIKRTHLSWWRGAVGTTCNLSGKHLLSKRPEKERD